MTTINAKVSAIIVLEQFPVSEASAIAVKFLSPEPVVPQPNKYYTTDS